MSRLAAVPIIFTWGICFAQSPVVDASGREIRPPAKVERVYAAGHREPTPEQLDALLGEPGVLPR